MLKKSLVLILTICFLTGCQSKEEKEEADQLAKSTLMVKNLSEIRMGNHSYEEIGEVTKRYKARMNIGIYNEWFDITNPKVQDDLRIPTISMNTFIKNYELENQYFTRTHDSYQYWLIYKGVYHISDELESSINDGKVKIYFFYQYNKATHKLENTEMDVYVNE